jgi:uncharacterized protein
MDHRYLVLKEDSKFEFHCHEGLDCFKKCCRDINIFLTPFDVLRAKNFLGISSGEFLEKYTLKVHAPHSGFSLVQIKMSEENDLKCPFITSKGCKVYQERPWSCRIAPVDMLGGGKYSFVFESSRCHGLNETKTQTIKEWVLDQGLEIYEEMEKGFSEITRYLKLTGEQEVDEKLTELFFTACYDLDQFRNLLVNNPFLLKKMDLDGDAIDKIMNDDVQLMRFGFELLTLGTDWLKNLHLADLNCD